MLKSLASFPKTVPSNHVFEAIEFVNPDALEVGGTLSDDAWAKAQRQADPHYDWSNYQHYATRITVEHPLATGGAAVWNVKTLTMSVIEDEKHFEGLDNEDS